MNSAVRFEVCRRLTLTCMVAMAAAGCLGQTATTPQNQRQTALALEQEGKNADAETAWREFLRWHLGSAEPYAHLGLIEARQEHYKEAVTLYRKALALNPSFPSLRLNLGLALFKEGEMKQAIAEFKPLLKSQSPTSPERQRLVILLGMAHYGLGEYAEAARYLRQAAAVDSQNLALRLSLAHSCMWSKQYQCVLDTYHEILTLNAESAEADMLAGEAKDELKDHGGAIDEFRAAVKANPKEPDVHFGLGYLLWTQKQYPEAVTEFQAELANDPNSLQSMIYEADAEIHLKDPEAALPLLEGARRIDANRELVHLDLGILYSDAGRNDDAVKEMKEAERLAPQDVNVHWRLGRLYRSMGRKDEAKAEFDKASSITNAADTALVDKISGDHSKGAAAQPHATPEK